MGQDLRHWAITVNHQTDGFGIKVFQDGLLTNHVVLDASTNSNELINPNELTNAAANLTVGAADNGWTGKLAHLRIWSTALSEDQIRQNRSRDVTAHAAFAASTGIEWRLLNANDEPSLYIYSSRGQQALHLEVVNITKGTTLVVPQESEPAAATSGLSSEAKTPYHFQLVFRRGAIRAAILETLRSADGPNAWEQANPGWHIHVSQGTEEDFISFLREGDRLELAAGEKLTLHLPRVAAEPGPGSRPTLVMLQYQNLEFRLPDGKTLPNLDGHFAQLLNILYNDPTSAYQKPPLEVGIVGAPVILNNGEQTTLMLYIKNLKRNEDNTADALLLGPANPKPDEAPKFILEIDVTSKVSKGTGTALQQLELEGLGDSDDLGNTSVVETYHPSPVKVEELGESGGRLRWNIPVEQVIEVDKVQRIGLEANETIFLTIADLKTTAPVGRSLLRLRYQDFEEYGEGVFEIPIEKVAAVPIPIAGSGDSKGYGLALGHDPRVNKDPGTATMPEMLSVKQTGDGDAVKIENVGKSSALILKNTGDDPGLYVVQNGNGPAAVFNGGNGVEVTGQDGNARLLVRQSGAAPSAKFSGGHGVEIENQLQATPQRFSPLVYLKLDQITDSSLPDASGDERAGSLYGSEDLRQLVKDEQFGSCLNFLSPTSDAEYSDWLGGSATENERPSDPFSDFEIYDSLTWGTIRKIEVYLKPDDGRLTGIKVTYANSELRQHGIFLGETQSIELSDNEFITRIDGRGGWAINQLTLTTNQGQTKSFGTLAGGSEFSADFGRKALVAFAGKVNRESHGSNVSGLRFITREIGSYVALPL
ncbi:MAG: jacalin-like lectin, partial [Nodosilinea sp.]